MNHLAVFGVGWELGIGIFESSQMIRMYSRFGDYGQCAVLFSIWVFDSLEEYQGVQAQWTRDRIAFPSLPTPVHWLLPFYAFAKIKGIHIKKPWSILNQVDPGYVINIIHISSASLALHASCIATLLPDIVRAPQKGHQMPLAGKGTGRASSWIQWH